jgi:hypothetical protein
MIDLGLDNLKDSTIAREVGNVLRYLVYERVLGAATEKVTKDAVGGAAEHMMAQAPRWGGLTFDDEAIEMAVEGAFMQHYRDEFPKIAAVRTALDPNENRLWRRMLTVIKLESLRVTNPRGKVTKKGKPGTDKYEEVIEALSMPLTPLSKDDPRVQHLHAVASLVTGDATSYDVTAATNYLRRGYLDHASVFSRVRAALSVVYDALVAAAPHAKKAADMLGTVLGQAAAHLILDPEEYLHATSMARTPRQRDFLLARAINARIAAIMAKTRTIEDEGFWSSLWRYRWWGIPVVLLGLLLLLS